MDKRTHPRIATEFLCRARFRVGDQVCTNVDVENLGFEGCRIRVRAAHASELKEAASLEGWRFSHPALPREELKAQVVWCRPPASPRDPFLEAGIRFQDLPAAFGREVESYVTAMIKSSFPAIDFSGMPT